jgi:hypothetical protein
LHRILTGSVIGALVSLALVVPSSPAGAVPPSGYVRVEGAGATLLPQTLVQTNNAKSVRGQTCSGSSAAGALNVATHGEWDGSFSSSLKDFFVTSILGESPSGNNFWTLWVNGRSSTTGACSTQLHPGDHELWFDCVADANFNCTNNPLALSVPASVRRGRKATVTVTQLDGNGHGTPVAGAAVSGGGVAAVTNATGQATFVPIASGVISLQAVKSGATPSDPQPVCVFASRRSQCGSVGKNGPPTHVRGIRNGQVFSGHGPRLLHGTAGPDPAGLTDVQLMLLRKAPGGRCTFFDGNRGSWQSRKCSSAPQHASFSVGPNSAWSYLLPDALPPGGYRLSVVATDSAGRHTKLVAGSSLVSFVVRS